MSLPLVHQDASLAIFRAMLLRTYNLEVPVVVPEYLSQWPEPLGDPLEKDPTLIFGGYFYNSSSPAPALPQIEKIVSESFTSGVSQFLVPLVRDLDDCRSLREGGFEKFPCFVEVVFEREGSLDAVLQNRLGTAQHKEVRRLVRRAEEGYELRFYTAVELTREPSLLAAAGELCGLSAREHGDRESAFGPEQLKILLHSSLGAHLVIALQIERGSGLPVVGIVCLLNREKSELYFMAIGFDRRGIPGRQNLYIASIYQIYRFAEQNDLHSIYLGRGFVEQKYRLGANRFFLLNHWIHSRKRNVSDLTSRLSRQFLKAVAEKQFPFPILMDSSTR